jgi:hypothetical protein
MLQNPTPLQVIVSLLCFWVLAVVGTIVVGIKAGKGIPFS